VIFARWKELFRKPSLSTAASEVLARGEEEARSKGRAYISTEHILVGLIKNEGICGQILSQQGVRLDVVRNRIEEIVGPPDPANPAVKLAFVPNAKLVVDQSAREAKLLGSTLVEPEHVLLALLHNSRGVASRVLELLAIDFNKLERNLLSQLDLPRSERGPIDLNEPHCGFMSDRDFRRGMAISETLTMDILVRHERIIGKSKRHLLELLGAPDNETNDRLIYEVSYGSGTDVLRFIVFLNSGLVAGYELIRTSNSSK
jgi:hypothetical protein